MTMTVTPRSPRQRNPVLGQLPPITHADGSPIRVLLVDDLPDPDGKAADIAKMIKKEIEK